MKIRGCFPMARQTSHVIVQPTLRPQKAGQAPRPRGQRRADAAHNRAASHNYFLLEKFEAGVALRGTEVKSIREGKANLKDSYGLIKDGEAFLLNVHIGPYSHGNMANHDETRTRKLLLHREEVRKLLSKTQIKGHTLIPTRLYFRNGRVKCELAVAKGKQDWDKRETEKRREADRARASRAHLWATSIPTPIAATARTRAFSPSRSRAGRMPTRAALEAGFAEGVIVGESQNFTRSLVNEPGNKLTPTILGQRAARWRRKSAWAGSPLHREAARAEDGRVLERLAGLRRAARADRAAL
jgi:SsrA-binding protein